MRIIFLPVVALVMVAIVSCKHEIKVTYPLTKKVDSVDNYFGTKVPDPYRWLENDKSEETAAWVKAENTVTFIPTILIFNDAHEAR